MTTDLRSFPPGFLWGSATAGHQVEGNNSNSDCWALEHASPAIFAEPSCDAVDQWNRFDDDMAILAAIGLKAYRFGIEWARIEPEEGVFARSALDHYQRCLDACHQRGIVPVVTFHHFTIPLWLARQGGMTCDRFPALFARYCETAARALRGLVVVCSMNEMNVPLIIQDVAQTLLTGEAGEANRRAGEAALGAPMSANFLFTPPMPCSATALAPMRPAATRSRRRARRFRSASPCRFRTNRPSPAPRRCATRGVRRWSTRSSTW